MAFDLIRHGYRDLDPIVYPHIMSSPAYTYVVGNNHERDDVCSIIPTPYNSRFLCVFRVVLEVATNFFIGVP
jgi:hypothetical protein